MKRLSSYNPGQNYLRKFSPSCPLSYATKLFLKRRLCGKKTPSPNSMLLPTNAQGSGFLLNTQQHCFQGKGYRYGRCFEKCSPSMQFSQRFVQDCSTSVTFRSARTRIQYKIHQHTYVLKGIVSWKKKAERDYK